MKAQLYYILFVSMYVKVFIITDYTFKIYQSLSKPILILPHFINIPGASPKGM